MSYDNDTADHAIRALKEEVAKIREEQFAKAFPLNSGGRGGGKLSSSIGGSLPTTGTATFIPNVIRLTKDTGVINKLNYKTLVPNMEFAINETITGGTSGATAIIGDIDILTSTTGVLTLKPNSISGTFTNNENLNGSINGNAKVDGTLYTQTGRGHLNAGSASIIVEGVATPYEIHFIDNAKNNGQIVLLRAQNGQTIRLRRAITTDANTGNLDLDSSFNIIENAIVILQYQGASNVTSDGGWVPVLSSVTSGGAGNVFDFPILYPKEDLGDQSGAVGLSLNQANGHYKRIRMIGNISLTFSSPPPSSNGFKFYVLLVQDGTGSRTLTALPASVKNGASILTQIDSAVNSQTLIQFVTADGGVTYHAQIIAPAGAGQDTPWQVDHDANTYDLFNLDKLRFAPAGGFSFPTDATVKGLSTSGTGIEANVPPSQQYRWYIGGFPHMTLDTFDLLMHDFNIKDVRFLGFTDSPSFTAHITSETSNARLYYSVTGAGSHHAFYVDNGVNANMEMRLNVNKSNVNLDMVTNDIINLDQAQFDAFGGFVSSIDHGQRRISGGNSGININVPKLKTVKLWFENTGQTNSDLKYEFRQDGLDMYTNNIFNVQGIFFPNAGSIIDLAGFGLEFLAGVNPPFGTGNPQTMNFRVRGPAPSYTQLDMFVLDGLGHNTTNGGGMKMSTDLNLQTQNIHNVDMINFSSNNGIVGGNQFAIAGSTDANRLEFNVPFFKSFSFRENDTEFMSLEEGLLTMNFVFSDPRIRANQFELLTHTLGTSGMVDGMIRQVNNGGSLDIMVGTGGFIRNLTNAFGTSFIGFTADADLNMGTFNIFNLDVLRYAVDSGVIGFGEYGSAVNAGNTKLQWSVPLGKFYDWQVNLTSIATLNTASFHMKTNTFITNPSIIADGAFILGANHANGTTGMLNGEDRLVGNDVIFRSGNTNVNLTTLSAGGADNLGDHTATQPLNMAFNTITNYLGWTSSGGHAFFVNAGLQNFQLGSSTDAFRWIISGNPTPLMELGITDLNVRNKQITNVSNPLNNLDAVNLQTLNSAIAGIDVSTWSTFPATSIVNLASNSLQNFTSWTNAFGQSWIGGPSGQSFNIGAGDSYDYNVNAVPKFSIGSVENDSFVNLNMNGFKVINSGATVGGDASTTLTTKGYVDSLVGGGIDTTANFTWTGSHTFNGASVSLIAPAIFIGNSIADGISVGGRFVTDLISSNLSDLGEFGNRWNVIYGTSLQLQFGAQINNITTNSSTNNNTSVMTSQAVQTLVASVGGVSLSGTNTWTGINTFNNGVLFNSAVGFVAGSIQPTAITGTAVNLNSTQTITGTKTFTQATFNISGNLNQDGGQIGFRGRTPQSITTMPSAPATLAGLQSTLNLLSSILRGMGIVG